MRCLSRITDSQGNEFNLMQINDFSVITSTIKGYTSPTTTNIWQASSHTPPSWMTEQGDLICRCNSSTIADLPQGKMVDDDFLLFKYGRVIQGNDSFYGMGFYNNKNSAARLGTFGDSSISGQTLDCYLGIVLDDDNQRAYILACTDKYNDPSNNKFRIWALAGKYNGTDLYWETFGEVILNQSAGGGGFYGGYKGGAGSGYIGNSLLSSKKMVGYNVPTSSAEGTKTESVNDVSASAVSGKPKSGNGFARIKFLREPDYYWIAQYTVGGTTYNLMQIGDVTIPDSIINATQMTCTAITGIGSTIPSFVTNLGDLIFDLQSSIDADVTLEFINNSFLRFLFGRYDYINSGTRMSGNQYYDAANSRVFSQGGWGNWGDGKVKYYIAVKIDKVNHRAYMIVLEHTYYHWAGNIGYTAYAIGGMPNGVDLLYETFKDVR